MTGEDVRQVCEALLPPDAIERRCTPWGVIERQRTLDLGLWVRAMVISAGTPGGADQADVRRSSLEGEVARVARSAFSRWFDAPPDRCMAALADRALAYARAPQVDRSGPLAGGQDGSSVDSTTVRVRDALCQEFPGTGEYPALTGHQVLSVGGGAPVRDHCSPAREPDSRHLALDASWRGYGLRADLGYASLARRRACEAHGVSVVIRRKDHWKPKVDSSARGQVRQTFCPGTDLEALRAQDSLRRDGRVIRSTWSEAPNKSSCPPLRDPQ